MMLQRLAIVTAVRTGGNIGKYISADIFDFIFSAMALALLRFSESGVVVTRDIVYFHQRKQQFAGHAIHLSSLTQLFVSHLVFGISLINIASHPVQFAIAVLT